MNKPITKKEWMEYLEKTWDAAQEEALAQPEQEPVAYPEGDVVGPCICGSWPGGKCLKCPRITTPPQPEQEPVAWMNEEMDYIFFDTERPEPFAFDFWKPLYTTPPQRTWVGLTAEEKEHLWERGGNTFLIEKVEALLKEKNNG